MTRKKRVLIGASAAVGALFGALMLLRTRQPDFTVMVDRQAQFLQQHGYLLGEEDAFDYYYKAISTLRAHGVTIEHVKAMTADDVFFRETREDLLVYLRGAARQRECRMPAPRYFHDVIQYKDKTLEVQEVESLLPYYVVQSLELDAGEHSPELGYICLALGVHLSKYRNHDVIWAMAIAMKSKALEWLACYYDQEGDDGDLAEVRDLRRQVQTEYQQYKDVIKKRWR